jgi:hypothetical protein
MLLKVPWHLLSYFWGSFIVLLWYSYHPAIIFLLYFYLTSTYSCVSIMGFTYGTHPLWTGRACHMGDHMAGQLHTFTYMYIGRQSFQLFLEPGLRVSSSISSHYAWQWLLLHVHSVCLMWKKMPFNNMRNSWVWNSFSYATCSLIPKRVR